MPPVRAPVRGFDRRAPDPRYLKLIETNGEQAATIRNLQDEIAYLRGTDVGPHERLDRFLDRAIDEARLQQETQWQILEVTDLLQAAAARHSGIEDLNGEGLSPYAYVPDPDREHEREFA